MKALFDVFGDITISSSIWPARSPDLDPCDFFWDGLNNKVYNNNPRTEEIKNIFIGKLQLFLENSFKG
jgi:hypothetical protein